MTHEEIVLRLVEVAALAQTVFLLIFIWMPWYRTWVGRGVFAESLALALLLDLSLVGHWWGPYPYQKQIGLAVVGLVAFAACLRLFALLHEFWRPTAAARFKTRRSRTHQHHR